MSGNQYKADPRQVKFLEYYLDTKSDTYSNALQSGLKAGYSQEYAENITHLMPDWLSERIGDEKLVDLAEKALLEALNYLTVDDNGKVDSGAGRLKLDAVKLVLKGLKKEKYSERSEHTGIDGTPINFILNKDLVEDEVSQHTKNSS